MLEFHNITIRDKEWVDELLSYSDFRGSEYCFQNNYTWAPQFNIKIARHNDFYIARTGNGESIRFLFPAGKGDIEELVCGLLKYMSTINIPLLFTSVNEKVKDMLETILPGRFSFHEVSSHFDYIYEAPSLIGLSGKKLHSKRNHINNFLREYSDWNLELITPENIKECEELNREWGILNNCDEFPQSSKAAEQISVRRGLASFFELGLIGGILRVNGKAEAFTYGSRINSDTFIINVEKALPSCRGAYSMINREFANLACREVRYINREDDAGDLGLRKAKLSYRPALFEKKYTAAAKKGG